MASSQTREGNVHSNKSIRKNAEVVTVCSCVVAIIAIATIMAILLRDKPSTSAYVPFNTSGFDEVRIIDEVFASTGFRWYRLEMRRYCAVGENLRVDTGSLYKSSDFWAPVIGKSTTTGFIHDFKENATDWTAEFISTTPWTQISAEKVAQRLHKQIMEPNQDPCV